jgi:hypothetical protein
MKRIKTIRNLIRIIRRISLVLQGMYIFVVNNKLFRFIRRIITIYALILTMGSTVALSFTGITTIEYFESFSELANHIKIYFKTALKYILEKLSNLFGLETEEIVNKPSVNHKNKGTKPLPVEDEPFESLRKYYKDGNYTPKKSWTETIYEIPYLAVAAVVTIGFVIYLGKDHLESLTIGGAITYLKSFFGSDDGDDNDNDNDNNTPGTSTSEAGKGKKAQRDLDTID